MSHLRSLCFSPKSYVKNLGMFFDSAFSFDSQVKMFVRFYLYHLRNIAKLSPDSCLCLRKIGLL